MSVLASCCRRPREHIGPVPRWAAADRPTRVGEQRAEAPHVDSFTLDAQAFRDLGDAHGLAVGHGSTVASVLTDGQGCSNVPYMTYWTLHLGNGIWTHAAWSRESPRTLCGRTTATAREWSPPGSEPGCQRCYSRVAAKRYVVRTVTSQVRAIRTPHRVIDTLDNSIVDEYASKRAAQMDADHRNGLEARKPTYPRAEGDPK